jgi:peptidoglycan/xylan/chitin deacetylase (PgdA/CDA1 family)
MLQAGHEIASHGWRWINYQDVPERVEREHMTAPSRSTVG